MLFNILLAILTLWTAVYIISYAVSLFKSKRLAEGMFLTVLLAWVTGLYINYILRIFLI